jgi:hypothetical protein
MVAEVLLVALDRSGFELARDVGQPGIAGCADGLARAGVDSGAEVDAHGRFIGVRIFLAAEGPVLAGSAVIAINDDPAFADLAAVGAPAALTDGHFSPPRF